MLAGIKRGTKKRKPDSNANDDDEDKATRIDNGSSASNSTVADELRLALQNGEFSAVSSTTASAGEGKATVYASSSNLNSDGCHRTSSIPFKSDSIEPGDPTVADMVRLEKQQSSMSHAQLEMRSIVRRNKRQSRIKGAVDSDEDEERQLANLKPSRKQAAGSTCSVSRRTTNHLPTGLMDSSWWWYDSSRFDRRRMLALGQSVTLSVAPAAHSLIRGSHLYLVPIPHATAWRHCEDDSVWMELRKFQASIRAWARSIGKGVLFWETVLVNQGAKQTRLEAIFLPAKVCQEAPLFFRAALTEIAEEWGTHQSTISTKYHTKELRKSIPKNFSYFYVEYGNNDDGAGNVQLIESKSFPRDFGIDTIAGMMRLDPLRFRSSQTMNDVDEQKMMQDVVEQWKPFDWTIELHGKRV